MERAADFELKIWRAPRIDDKPRAGVRVFVAIVLACVCLSALMASWLPLQFSVITVFLFAGPHNWFELRYFVMRLPARFGRSRNFFAVSFAGIGLLTVTYISLPALYYSKVWSGANWPTAIAIWNTMLLLWIAALVWLRGRQRHARDWSWALPIAFALISLNWLGPELFSLGIVYTHPLVALWFLDRHLRRTRPEWLPAYRRCLCLLPLLLVAITWQLARTPSLSDDNGLAWRITQHAGSQILPNISSHLLVSLHVFLEMLHYGVWLVALPLIGSTRARNAPWNINTIPLARHPRGFPRLILAVMVLALFLVGLLWFGFAFDYATTRDIYFTVAIGHVVAEAPFLLRMI
jgi:hypothetical protein